MALKPLKYVKIDDEEGILYSAGKRALLIPVAFVMAIHIALERIVGRPGAQILVYKIGQGLGKEYVKTLEAILKEEEISLDKEMLIREVYNAIFMAAGWGKSQITNLNLLKHQVTVRIVNAPSGQLIKGGKYDLERGILAGAYQEIVGREVYFDLVEEEKKKNLVIFKSFGKIPERILAKEKMVLVARKELEQRIQVRTKELQEKIVELEKFMQLTIGRELRMIELKKELQSLRGQAKKKI